MHFNHLLSFPSLYREVHKWKGGSKWISISVSAPQGVYIQNEVKRTRWLVTANCCKRTKKKKTNYQTFLFLPWSHILCFVFQFCPNIKRFSFTVRDRKWSEPWKAFIKRINLKKKKWRGGTIKHMWGEKTIKTALMHLHDHTTVTLWAWICMCWNRRHFFVRVVSSSVFYPSFQNYHELQLEGDPGSSVRSEPTPTLHVSKHSISDSHIFPCLQKIYYDR